MSSKKVQVRSVADWQRAPKDGSIINVEFPDGEIAQAKWDFNFRDWQLPRPDGAVVLMHREHHDVPQDWWPVF